MSRFLRGWVCKNDEFRFVFSRFDWRRLLFLWWKLAPPCGLRLYNRCDPSWPESFQIKYREIVYNTQMSKLQQDYCILEGMAQLEVNTTYIFEPDEPKEPKP